MIDGFGRPEPQGELVVQRVVVLHGRDGQLEGIARGEYRVLVEGRGGVVQRRNGGGLAAADALGLDGDLAERVDGLLARGRLTVGVLAGGPAGSPHALTVTVRSGCSESASAVAPSFTEPLRGVKPMRGDCANAVPADAASSTPRPAW